MVDYTEKDLNEFKVLANVFKHGGSSMEGVFLDFISHTSIARGRPKMLLVHHTSNRVKHRCHEYIIDVAIL
jgi:hypothetical protein